MLGGPAMSLSMTGDSPVSETIFRDETKIRESDAYRQWKALVSFSLQSEYAVESAGLCRSLGLLKK